MTNGVKHSVLENKGLEKATAAATYLCIEIIELEIVLPLKIFYMILASFR